MKKITAQQVEQSWLAAKEWDDKKMASLMQEMGDEQPLLMAYLVSVGEDLLNEDEEELLFFFGVLLWQMMEHKDEPIEELTEEALHQAESANASLVELFDGEPTPAQANRLAELLESYPQPELLNFVVEVVSEGVKDGDIRPTSYGPMILYLKVVIDGLNRVNVA
jgi:hypothetical protein